MKRTHKLQALGDVQAVVDASPNLTIAAQRLGVNRSTLTRWMQAEKVTRPASLPAVGAVTVPEAAAVEGWAAGVLAAHRLTDTERTTVELADIALRLARNPETAAFTQLAAMREFRAAWKQLNLGEKRIDAGKATEKPAATAPKTRVGGDPRAFLMAFAK